MPVLRGDAVQQAAREGDARLPDLRPPLPAVGVDPARAARSTPARWDERDAGLQSVDALGFVDQKAVPGPIDGGADRDRACATPPCGAPADRRRTEVAICVMDFGFMGGSMGAVVGEKVTRAAEDALAARIPLVVVSSSGGARMQEGTLALMQLAKTLAAIERLRAAGVPFISVLTDPTTGGVFASFAALGDVNVAEPNALIGFAGARVSAGTIAAGAAAGLPALRVPVQPRVRGPRRRAPGPARRAGPPAALAAACRPRRRRRRRCEVAARSARLPAAVVPERPRRPRRPRPAPTARSRSPCRTTATETATEEVWGRVQLARNLRRPRTLEFVDADDRRTSSSCTATGCSATTPRS